MTKCIPHIFIAYSHKDKAALDDLKTHLEFLQRRKMCTIFFDGEIKPGDRWRKRIKDELHRADIFVLLVSADFLNSDYVNEVELPKILAKEKEGTARVLPVILKKCLWRYSDISELQVITDNGKPILPTGDFGEAADKIAKVVTEQAARRAIDPFYDLMIPIEDGTFQMGDEHGDLWKACRPVHQVTVKDFHLCQYPVTQAQWRKVMGSDPPELKFKGCDDCPVEGVSWDDVQEFIKKLNEKTGGNYRLPTEAEWEFAARGGRKSKGYQYAGSNDVNKVAWYGGNSNSRTHPVGQKEANELDLYDMSGNVWEWCEDLWHDNYKGAPDDGRPWISGGDKGIRVVRGGSWDDGNGYCRAADRLRINLVVRYGSIGFRLAR